MNEEKQSPELATFGGGCFWCVEAVFQHIRGVESVQSGYAGGESRAVSYDEVCSGSTGHAEVVQLRFDPAIVSYRQLLDVFFSIHDPTTRNRQGADVGPQYRSCIFFHTEEQKTVAKSVIAKLEATGDRRGAVVTEVCPFTFFVPAESEHQAFYQRNPAHPYSVIVTDPKVQAARRKFSRVWTGNR